MVHGNVQWFESVILIQRQICHVCNLYCRDSNSNYLPSFGEDRGPLILLIQCESNFSVIVAVICFLAEAESIQEGSEAVAPHHGDRSCCFVNMWFPFHSRSHSRSTYCIHLINITLQDYNRFDLSLKQYIFCTMYELICNGAFGIVINSVPFETIIMIILN